MNTEERERDSGGFGDALTIALVLMVLVALGAGIFLWFFALRQDTSFFVIEDVRPAQIRTVPPSGVKEAESPFSDEETLPAK